MQEKRAAVKIDMQEKRDEMQAEREKNLQGAFCARFTENMDRLSKNISEREGNFEYRKENREGKIEDSRTSRDAALDESRSQADERREAMYKKLEDQTKTDTEKEAVKKFRNTVEKAVEVRRAAVDAAIISFREGVNAATSGRKGDMEKAVENYKKAVDSAAAKAKSGCEDGVNADTVRSDFNTAMESARKTLQSERQGADKVGEQVKKLALSSAKVQKWLAGKSPVQVIYVQDKLINLVV